MYAILSHGGRQYRVTAGDRLIVDRLDAAVGSVVALEPVLLTGGDGSTGVGKDVEGMRVAAFVVGHPRGRKLRIFKYKAKKRYRRAAGYRSDLTELRVDSILAKGAALPKAAAAAEPAAATATVAVPARRAPKKPDAVAAEETTPATAAAAPPAARPRRRSPAPTTEAEPAVEAPARKARPTSSTAKAEAPAPRTRKPAKGKESGDGA